MACGRRSSVRRPPTPKINFRLPRSDPVRHAVIGLGGFGSEHARATHTSKFGDLIAVVDSDPEARRRITDSYPATHFRDHQSLIEAGTAESVSIALPHSVKDDVARDCLAAGLHVYVEKPLALRATTARQLVAMADSAGVRFSVGHQYRTFRGYRTIERLLRSGAVGEVHQILWTWHQFRSDAYFERTPWLDDWDRSGGGLLPLQLAHDLDLICWLFGSPLRVGAFVGETLHHRGVEDLATAFVEFRSGAVATLQASLNRPGSYVVRQIVGDRGMIVVPASLSMTTDHNDGILFGRFEHPLTEAVRYPDGHSQPTVEWETVVLSRAQGEEAPWKRPRRVWRRLGLSRARRGMEATLDSFFRSIRDRGELLVDARSAIPGVELREAMIVSAATGGIVDIPASPPAVADAYQVMRDRLSRGA